MELILICDIFYWKDIFRRRISDGLFGGGYFYCPSIEDNLPNTVVESMSCGTPVAAFNIGGMPDMIENRKWYFSTTI